MNNWTDVGVEKPEEGLEVLIAYENFGKCAGLTTAVFCNGLFFSGSSYPHNNVTHWMKLPNKPDYKE